MIILYLIIMVMCSVLNHLATHTFIMLFIFCYKEKLFFGIFQGRCAY